MSTLPLDQVRTLLAVVEHGTFDAAASALHVTPSAISQRVKTLEQLTGRVLLERTKPVRLTSSGEVVMRFARQLAQLEHDTHAELGLADAGAPARVPIAVNADSIATWFLPALTELTGDPPTYFDLHRADEAMTVALLRDGSVMAAVTSTPDPVPGCSVRRLGHMRYLAAASPAVVDRWLPDFPDVPLRRTLPDVPVIVFDRHDDLQDAFVRKLTRGHRASTRRHYVRASEGFVHAIVLGLGWGMVPEPQARPHLESGALVQLAPDRPVDVPLYWQQWKLDSPVLAAVTDAVTAAATRALS